MLKSQRITSSEITKVEGSFLYSETPIHEKSTFMLDFKSSYVQEPSLVPQIHFYRRKLQPLSQDLTLGCGTKMAKFRLVLTQLTGSQSFPKPSGHILGTCILLSNGLSTVHNFAPKVPPSYRFTESGGSEVKRLILRRRLYPLSYLHRQIFMFARFALAQWLSFTRSVNK